MFVESVINFKWFLSYNYLKTRSMGTYFEERIVFFVLVWYAQGFESGFLEDYCSFMKNNQLLIHHFCFSASGVKFRRCFFCNLKYSLKCEYYFWQYFSLFRWSCLVKLFYLFYENVTFSKLFIIHMIYGINEIWMKLQRTSASKSRRIQPKVSKTFVDVIRIEKLEFFNSGYQSFDSELPVFRKEYFGYSRGNWSTFSLMAVEWHLEGTSSPFTVECNFCDDGKLSVF